MGSVMFRCKIDGMNCACRLVAFTDTTVLVPYVQIKPLKRIKTSGTRTRNLLVLIVEMRYNDLTKQVEAIQYFK